MNHATTMAVAAVESIAAGFAVFPLNGKVPAIKCPHPKDVRCRGREDGCGLLGHGVLDATTNADLILRWWGTEYVGANIGGRVPAGLAVLDVDPRHGGHVSLAELEDQHGQLPPTLTVWSGSDPLSRHLYFIHPGGQIRKPQRDGLDLKTHGGYCVLPPSLHPDTGKPYRWDDDRRTPLAMPGWLVDLIRPPKPPPAPVRPAGRITWTGGGTDLIGDYNRSARWGDRDLLGDWTVIDGDGEHDGARWLHPAATSACSATVRGGRLYVYSTNTPFEATDASTKRGYSKFDAFVLLRHNRDQRAALRELRRQHDEQLTATITGGRR